MPISDTYVVQYLLQATQEGSEILWIEKEPSGHVAKFRGMQLEIVSVPGRAGPRLFLSISCASERIQIHEPANCGIFREKYESEDDQRLVGLLKELVAAVAGQCSARRKRSAEKTEVIRQSIYGRLIGAEV